MNDNDKNISSNISDYTNRSLWSNKWFYIGLGLGVIVAGTELFLFIIYILSSTNIIIYYFPVICCMILYLIGILPKRDSSLRQYIAGILFGIGIIILILLAFCATAR